MIRGSPQLGSLTVSVRSTGKTYIDGNNTEQLILKSLPQCSGNICYNPWEWAKGNLHLLPSLSTFFYVICSSKEKKKPTLLHYYSHLLSTSAVGNISKYFRRNPCVDIFHRSNLLHNTQRKCGQWHGRSPCWGLKCDHAQLKVLPFPVFMARCWAFVRPWDELLY